MVEQDIKDYFPRYTNPVVFPEVQDGKPLTTDNFVVRLRDIDNDGKLELLVLYQGKIKVYDDPLDFRSPTQTYTILEGYDLGGEGRRRLERSESILPIRNIQLVATLPAIAYTTFLHY